MAISEKSFDPKGLIYEAYRMDGLGEAECRSIFLDWALSLPEGIESGAAIEAMLALYQEGAPEHPMTVILIEGRHRISAPRRRGGWKSRPRN